MKKKMLLIPLALLLAMSLVAMGCPPLQVEPPVEPIKIGALFDFTGPAGVFGPRWMAGAELALERANWEVAGRPIEFIVEDSATCVTTALEKLKKLVEVDGVRVVIGPLMGDAHLALAPFAAEHRILMTTLFNGLDAIVPFGNWIIYPTLCVVQQIPLGWYAYDVMGHRTMITVGADYAGGHEFIAGVVYGFEQRGGEVVQELWVPLGTVCFGPYIAAFVDADVVAWFFPDTPSVVLFVTQYREFGVEIPMLSTTVEGDMPTPVLEELGDKILGVRGSEAYPSFRDDPINNAFVEAMIAKTGVRPGAIEQNAYVMTSLILAGLEITGGDDSFDKLWPAVVGIEMDTPAGPLSFTPEGVGITCTYILEARIIEGEYVWYIVYHYPAVRDPRLPGWVLEDWIFRH